MKSRIALTLLLSQALTLTVPSRGDSAGEAPVRNASMVPTAAPAELQDPCRPFAPRTREGRLKRDLIETIYSALDTERPATVQRVAEPAVQRLLRMFGDRGLKANEADALLLVRIGLDMTEVDLTEASILSLQRALQIDAFQNLVTKTCSTEAKRRGFPQIVGGGPAPLSSRGAILPANLQAQCMGVGRVFELEVCELQKRLSALSQPQRP